jgi:hypothetical protein
LPPDETRRAVLREILGRFVAAPELGDTAAFALGEAAPRYFDEVVGFLHSRVGHARTQENKGVRYQALPFEFTALPPVPADAQASVRRWQENLWQELLAAHPWRHDEAHRLFRIAFARSTDALEAFLFERAKQAVTPRELESVVAVLQQEQRGTVPWLPAVMRQVLLTVRERFAPAASEVEGKLTGACLPSTWGWKGDKLDEATLTVLETLRRLCAEWAHDPVMGAFLQKTLAEAETRYRRL